MNTHLQHSLVVILAAGAAGVLSHQAQGALYGPMAATADAVARTTNGGASWAIDASLTASQNVSRSTDGASESRVVIEFGALPIAGPVHVNSASLRFNINVLFTDIGDKVLNSMVINFYGYADANGSINAADAANITTLVAASPLLGSSADGLGLYSVAMDAGFIETVINSRGRVGLVARNAVADSDAAIPRIFSVDNNPATWGGRFPALTVDYTIVPEPALPALAVVAMALLTRRRRASGLLRRASACRRHRG